jgi:hypothetical protein
MGGLLSAGGISSNDVEVVMDGKRYKSSHDYKREKIKTVFLRVLTPNVLQDFKDEEIFEIIAEVRKSHLEGDPVLQKSETENQHSGGSSATLTPLIKDVPDSSTSEMQKMLNLYQREHTGAVPIVIDPDKVKNVIIEPTYKPISIND